LGLALGLRLGFMVRA